MSIHVYSCRCSGVFERTSGRWRTVGDFPTHGGLQDDLRLRHVVLIKMIYTRLSLHDCHQAIAHIIVILEKLLCLLESHDAALHIVFDV